jgi:hypothetical protein
VGRPLLSLAMLAALLLAAASTATAAPGHPPRGKVLLGVATPDPDSFDRVTGRKHRLRLIFGNFARDLPEQLENERAAGRIPILTLSSNLPPAAIARGGEDARLLYISRSANEFGGPVWFRPLAEMNGHWNAWSAFDASGRPRGPAHSTREFVRAFRRMAIIVRGGPLTAIDARLRAAALPPLRRGGAGGDIRAGRNVAVVWNPQGRGSPDIRGNQPRDYWPGPAYVDYVANDLYEIKGRAVWEGMEEMYRDFPKPYVIAEWAPWGYDSPAFVRKMFDWVATHPRTVAVVYFDRGWSGGAGTFELARKPQSLAAYRAAVRHARFVP